jgi:O-antigen/teichoic acid export membrane protein
VLRNAFWLTVQPLVLNVLSIASTAYIARTIGAADFGRFGLALAFVTLFAPITNRGLRARTIRDLTQGRVDPATYVGRMLMLRSALAAVAFLVVVAAAPLSGGSDLTRGVIAVAGFNLLASTVASVMTDAFQSLERMTPITKANFAGGLALTVAQVAAVALGGNIVTLAFAYSVGPLVTAAWLVVAARGLPIYPVLGWNPRMSKRLLREGLPLFGTAMLETASGRMDMLVLARVLGEGNLGGYTAASMLLGRAWILVEALSTALLPTLSRQRTTDRDGATALFGQSWNWMLALTLPAMGVCLIAPRQLLGFFFGEQYLDATLILQLAAPTLVLGGASALIAKALFAGNRTGAVAKAGSASSVVKMVLVIPAVILWGAVGAVLSRYPATAASAGLRWREAASLFPGFTRRIRLGDLAAAQLAWVLPFAGALVWPAGAVGLVGGILMGGAAYLALLARQGLFPGEWLAQAMWWKRPAPVGQRAG